MPVTALQGSATHTEENKPNCPLPYTDAHAWLHSFWLTGREQLQPPILLFWILDTDGCDIIGIWLCHSWAPKIAFQFLSSQVVQWNLIYMKKIHSDTELSQHGGNRDFHSSKLWIQALLVTSYRRSMCLKHEEHLFFVISSSLLSLWLD